MNSDSKSGNPTGAVRRLSDFEMNEYIEIFRIYSHGKSYLTPTELLELYRAMKSFASHIKWKSLKLIDTNHDGTVTLEDFISFLSKI